MYPLCERETFFIRQKACTAACRNESDCLYELVQSFVLLPVFNTFTIDFEQFEFQLKLDQNQSLALIFRTSGPWNLETFIRTSGLQSLGTWSSESSSPQKMETFIRTSGLQNLWHLIRNATSEAGTVHQNFLSQNLQLGFWGNDQNLQKLTCIRVRNSVIRSASEWNLLSF